MEGWRGGREGGRKEEWRGAGREGGRDGRRGKGEQVSGRDNGGM